MTGRRWLVCAAVVAAVASSATPALAADDATTVISRLTLTSPGTVSVGDTLTYESDSADSGATISSGQADFTNEDGQSLEVDVHPGTDTWSVTVLRGVAPGTYQLTQLRFFDGAGDLYTCFAAGYCEEEWHTGTTPFVPPRPVTVVNDDYDGEAPTVTWLHLTSPSTATTGDEVTVSSDAYDAYGLASGSLHLSDGNQYLDVPLDPATASFEGPVPDTIKNGSYTFVSVEVTDTSGNTETCWADQRCLHHAVRVDYTGVAVTVVDSTADATPPTISYFHRIDGDVAAGSTVEFATDAQDVGSGLTLLTAEFVGPHGRTLTAWMEPSDFTRVSLWVPSDAAGPYYLTWIELGDGNQNDERCWRSSCPDGASIDSTGADFVVPGAYDADTTPPTVTPVPARSPNANGWYRAPVDVQWVVDDGDGYGLGGQSPPPTLRADTEGRDVEYLSEPACDVPGNCARGSFVASIDETAPGVVATPSASAYDVDQTVTVTCTAQDALSGVAGCPDYVQDAYRLPLGPSPVTVTGSDLAGNSATATADVRVDVTSRGLRALTQRLCSDTECGTELSLPLYRYDLALSDADRQAALDDYRDGVMADSGRRLTADDAADLVRVSRGLDPATA